MNWPLIQSKVSDLTYLLSIPTSTDNKYSRGVLGVIAGSNEYPGAAILNISAAIHTGVGMVRYLGESELTKDIIQSNPEVVLVDGRVDGYLIGSGIDREKLSEKLDTRVRDAVISNLPLVLDAGALEFAQPNRSLQLLTPHTGELVRLLSHLQIEVSTAQVASEPVKYAQLAAEKLQSSVLLKGSTTYVAVAGNQVVYQISGITPWLATAGSGDVLAGIIAGIMVQQSDISDQDFINCALLGVHIHSKAAQLASKGGPIGASDIPQLISRVIADFFQ